MDSLTHLALMAKAKLVFESQDNFLSFPALAPLAYTAEQLNFGSFDSPIPAERLVYSEFSRVANSIPSGTVFNPSESFLWDAYKTVLFTAIAAQGETTEEEDDAYQQALSFLGGTDTSGIRTASPELIAYEQCRNAWFNAVQNYRAQQGTAEATTDPAARAQWKDVEEPWLRGLVDQARADWEANGFKRQVENAKEVKASHEARSPQATRNKWRTFFIDEIDLLTDPNAQSFAPTSFVPNNIFGNDWPTFRVSGSEISQLAEQAPKELRDIFVLGTGEPEVEELSFEYRSVTLARPWFRPEVFAARFWRLPDGVGPLSDGANPPHGSCPAYVAALVFVRNIQVKLRPTPTAPPSPPLMIRSLPAMRFVAASPAAGIARMRLIAEPLVQPSAVAMAAVAETSPLTASAVVRKAVFRPAMMTADTMRLTTVQPIPSADAISPGSPPSASRAPSTPPPAPAVDPRKDISILAFVCKRLPKTPDPDPNLVWDA